MIAWMIIAYHSKGKPCQKPFFKNKTLLSSMEVRFLGTNGWFDTRTGNTTCVFINSRNYYIILDAGNGIYKIGRYIKEAKPVCLFLSHFHLDHIIGLHILNKFHFPAGLVLFGMEGTDQVLQTLVNEPFTIPFADYSYPVTIRELSEGTHAVPFPVECRALLHSTRCFGYRITVDGTTITYCTDTGVCDNAIHLARNADLLITECSLKPGKKNPGWPHLNPQDAIFIAQESNAKRLALIHFDAEVYKKITERKKIRDAMKKYFPGLIVATDGKKIIL
jgi:ribonuclease BN (tRNA processing enzyme)